VDHLDSKNFVPFKKRRNGYHLPVLTKRAEEQIIDEVDPDLRPEEQGYVRHYLGYADVMLKKVEEEEKAARELAAEEQAAVEQAMEEVPEASAGEAAPIESSNVTEMPKPEPEENGSEAA